MHYIRNLKLHLCSIIFLTVLALLQRPSAPISALKSTFMPGTDHGPMQVGGAYQVYLPVIFTPPGAPQFQFISPLPNTSVGGTIFVAIQPLSHRDVITGVTFKVDDIDLAPADGLRAFLDAKTLPAGLATLTAVATGPGGSTTHSITVTIVPNPPTSGPIHQSGGVLASQTGSAITFLPNTVPNNTNVTVSERTQEQVTAQHGIEWETIGVTFLGDQEVQSSASLTRPLGMVSSAGYGNRVQPGQAVVNYMILPDANGDGVDELVVIRTASVAPNDDVILDPVALPLVSSVTGNDLRRTTQFANVIAGPPGEAFVLEVDGFNAFSTIGNVAMFESAVDGTTVEYPVILTLAETAPPRQIALISLPYLPVGEAFMTLKNISSGHSTEPISVHIEQLPELNQPPQEIFDAQFDNLIQGLQDAQGSSLTTLVPGETLTQTIASLQEAQASFTAIYAHLQEEPFPEAEQLLADAAKIYTVENNIMLLYSGDNESLQGPMALIDCAHPPDTSAFFNSLPNYQSTMPEGSPLEEAGALISARSPAMGSVVGTLSSALEYAQMVYQGLMVGVNALKWANGCGSGPAPSPGAQQGTAVFTGMGSAPPPGGNGVGNVNPMAVVSQPPLAGRVQVKIFNDGQVMPFTGVTDAGGYFFVPFIPAGEPFTAVAIDTITTETRVYNGVGPATGDNVFIFFDFGWGESEPTLVWDGGGDGTSWHDPQNWDLDRIPNASDRVEIDVSENITVVHSSGNTTVLALHSANNVSITGGSFTVQVPSTVNGTFSMASGTTLRADGIVASFTANGTTLVAQANFYALNGGKITLPNLTSYSGGGIDRVWRATGLGSELAFPNLTSLDATTYHRILVDALDGGKVDLSSLPSIGPANVWLFASGTNSYIDLSSATEFVAYGSLQRGRIEAVNNGTVLMDSLLELHLVDLVVNPGGTIPVQQITRLTAGTITLDSLSLTLTALTNFNQSSIFITGDAVLSLPGLTSYSGGGIDRVWRATGAGSEIIFPNLASLNATTYHRILVDALDGGKVDLSSLPSIGPANMWFLADGANSQIDLSSATEFVAYGSLQRGRIEAVDEGAVLFTAGTLNINIADIFLNVDGVVSGGTIVLGNNARLLGTGTLDANVVNGGEVSPAGTIAGVITIGGNYTQTAVGKLITHVGGPSVGSQYDQLAVTGTAAIDGTLEITLINSYDPGFGSSFSILTAVSRSGTFATVTGTAIGPGKQFQVNYLANGVALEVVPG